MTISAGVVAVTSTATALNAADTSGFSLIVNSDADVDLGDSSVTFGTGLRLLAIDAPLKVEVDAGDVLFAVASATANVGVLRT